MSTHAERLEAAKAGRPAAEFRPPDLETDPAPSLTEHAHEVMRHLDAATVWHVELLATLSEACLRRKKALDKEVEIARKKAEQERRKQRREQHNYEMTSAADEDYYLDGSAVGAVLSMPWGVASEVGAGGAVYLVDSRNHCVHKYVGLGGAGAPGAPAFSTLEFILGDGLENDAVDELVRSMVPGTTRRATVPAAFGLGGGGSQSAPSYLELNVRAVLGKGEYREEERAAQRCDEGEPLPVLCKPPPQQRVGGG